jgi:hypothetical protein
MLLAFLMPIPYWIGARRWFPTWRASTWGIGAMAGVVFLPWYAVLTIVGGSDALVPVAMVALVGAFAIGRWHYWLQVREIIEQRRSSD